MTEALFYELAEIKDEHFPKLPKKYLKKSEALVSGMRGKGAGNGKVWDFVLQLRCIHNRAQKEPSLL